jgi:D-amino-acid dehydrogenase
VRGGGAVRVIVIGGGAVGLCVAEAVSARDCEVTLLERERCGGGASAGNAGWITPSLATPVPGPGVIGASLRWLADPSGPLWIRPTTSPTMVSWIAQFIASCRSPVYRSGLAALQLAAALAGPAFDALAARGLEFELHDDPLLFPAFEDGELNHLWHMSDELRRAGSRQPVERLSAGELRALEPALGDDVRGGLAARGERRVRPELFTAGVARALAERGVEVLEHAPATRLRHERQGWRVESPAGAWRADAVVIASGVTSPRLLAPLGLRLPLVAAKGYSRTYPPDRGGPQHAIYLEKPKVAISVFNGGVRVSGTLELGARGLALSRRRLAAITAAAQRALPRWTMPAESDDWAGMRPLSPDGLPFIWAVPGRDGLHLATGHATLGIALAPLTGELVAGRLVDGPGSGLLEAPRVRVVDGGGDNWATAGRGGEWATADVRARLLASFDPARALRRGGWIGSVRSRVGVADRTDKATRGGRR